MIHYRRLSRPLPCRRVAMLVVLVLTTSVLPGQSIHKVAGSWDAVSAPSAAPMPGLRGAFREQVLIDAARLVPLRGKRLLGLVVRRNLDGSPLVGGTVDWTVHLSTTATPPAEASPVFADNAAAAQQTLVFRGAVVVPDSPIPATPLDPWSPTNAFAVTFTPSVNFVYAGGTLVLDLTGTPRQAGAPHFWYVDQEEDPVQGAVTSFGLTCSTFHASGQTLTAQPGIQIGNPLRLVGFSRPGASSLLLLGAAIPGGFDLGVTGAPGCFQHVGAALAVGLVERGVLPNFYAACTNFELRVPPAAPLLGTSVCAQMADLETGLPKAQWTNAAGLTTSNALRLDLAKQAPALGLATVRSDEVESNKPFPDRGDVDVRRGPVLRLVYQ